MAQKTLLERIEAMYGKVAAFDGRLCFWANSVPHDVRDVARRLKADVGDVCDVMPVFEAPKRGRRSAAVSDSGGVQDAGLEESSGGDEI